MNESRSLDRRDIWLSLSTAIGAIDMSESQLLSYWSRDMTREGDLSNRLETMWCQSWTIKAQPI